MKRTLFLLWLALIVALPVFAQDDEPITSEPLAAQIAELQQNIEAATVDTPASTPRESDVPQGINILIALVAVGAIASVGLAVVGKEITLAPSSS
jgi:hypothetical protein